MAAVGWRDDRMAVSAKLQYHIDHLAAVGANAGGAAAVVLTACAVLYCTVAYCSVLHCTVLHCTVLYCTVLYCTVLHCTVLYCTALYCTALHCTVLHCTVLHCTVLCRHYCWQGTLESLLDHGSRAWFARGQAGTISHARSHSALSWEDDSTRTACRSTR